MGEIERREYVIWSNEHAAWWRAESRGYTNVLSSAGLYTNTEADKICASITLPREEEKRHVSEVLEKLGAELARIEKQRNEVLCTIQHFRNFLPAQMANGSTQTEAVEGGAT